MRILVLGGTSCVGRAIVADAGSWDAVVDVSGYVPRHVGQPMDELAQHAARASDIDRPGAWRLQTACD